MKYIKYLLFRWFWSDQITVPFLKSGKGLFLAIEDKKTVNFSSRKEAEEILSAYLYFHEDLFGVSVDIYSAKNIISDDIFREERNARSRCNALSYLDESSNKFQIIEKSLLSAKRECPVGKNTILFEINE